MRNTIIFLIAFTGVAGCPGPDGMRREPATPPNEAIALCEPACIGLRRASCKEGFPTPRGELCLVTCQRSAELLNWPLRCWAAANSRADILACGGARCAAATVSPP